MRTVIVGFGKSARIDAKMKRYFPKGAHHLNMEPPFELVGVTDRDPRARANAYDAGLAPVVTVEELAYLEPEAAVLNIPPEGRAEILAALPSVRAVMLEKPLGPPAMREPLLEIIEQRKIITQVAYWRRGDPTLRALPDIGAVQAGFGLFGGGLRNNGSHLIDMVRMLLGEVVCVQATGRSFVLDLDAPSGQVSIHELDFRHYREVSLEIWGERGRIAIEQEGLLTRMFPRVSHRGLEDAREIACDLPWLVPCRVADALPNLYRNLARAITDGEPLLSPLVSALKTERVLDLLEAKGLGP